MEEKDIADRKKEESGNGRRKNSRSGSIRKRRPVSRPSMNGTFGKNLKMCIDTIEQGCADCSPGIST